MSEKSPRNDFYVYVHKRKSDNTPFYVGKGSGRRARKTSAKRSKEWMTIFKEHGLIIDYIAENLTEENAFRIENETIVSFRNSGFDLCNLTDGGKGGYGKKISDEMKSILSKSGARSFLGKTHSEESRLKMSIAKKGKKQSDEHKAKVTESKIIKDKYEFIHKSGIKEFCTRHELVKKYNLRSGALSALFSGKIKSTKGWSVIV